MIDYNYKQFTQQLQMCSQTGRVHRISFWKQSTQNQLWEAAANKPWKICAKLP